MSDFFHYKIKKHKIQVQIIKICRVTKKYSRDFFSCRKRVFESFSPFKISFKNYPQHND